MTSSFVVAPSVQWTETDATLTTTSGVTKNAGFVGEFLWGPAEDPTYVSSGETGLVQTFWKPTKDLWLDFLVLVDYFRYAKSAWIVRALKTGALNSVPATFTPELIGNDETLEAYTGDIPVLARYAGALGNNLNVFVMDAADFAIAKAEYATGFRSGLALLYSKLDDKSDLTADETYHIFVLDTSGAIAGTTPTTYPNRKKLVIDWAAEAHSGLHLGTLTGTSRITVQWTSDTPPANDAELAAELIRQFKLIPENVKRRNNIRAIALSGTSDFEVEFYSDPGAATWYATAGAAFTSATVTPVTITSYGELLEKFEHASAIEGSTKYDGSNAYYYDVIRSNSSYVAFTKAFEDAPLTGLIELRSGSDGTGTANFQSCYDLLEAKEYEFLPLIGQGQTIENQQAAIDTSLTRRTSVSFTSPLRDFKDTARKNKLAVLREWRNTDLLRDNSYFFMDDNWGEVYDKYNNVYRWIPCCGGTAGLWMRSIGAAGIGKSPAFYNRGKYLGYRRMARSSNDDERSEIYNELGINSIVSEKEGIILMGDKTGLSRTSAFSRINVRGVFIEAEINISNTAKYILGENNDVFTQSLFRNSVEPYLRGKKQSGEILDYRVKCDESNNTGQVVSENKFVAGIWIKPQYSINWVFLDFIALRPDMEFSELEGSYGIVGF